MTLASADFTVADLEKQRPGWWTVRRPSGVTTSFRKFEEAQELLERLPAGVILWGEDLP